MSQTQFWAGGVGNDRFNGPGDVLGVSLYDFGPVGSEGFNVIGGAGDDTLSGANQADTLDGGAENDSLSGGFGFDLLIGGGGLDLFDGGPENDVIVESSLGDAGNLDAAATIDGGGGFDELRLLGTTRLVGTVINDVERLSYASLQSGTITINATAFATFTALALSASSTPAGVLSHALIQGRGGTYDFSTKIIQVSAGDAIPVVRFRGGAGDEEVTGTDAGDELDAGAGNNHVSGGDGDDYLTGGGTIEGGEGADTVRDGQAGSSSDRLRGEAGDDSIVSFVGADTLLGGAGNDTLRILGGGALAEGGEGQDTLEGRGGFADSLFGGADDDLLTDGGTLGAADVLDGGAGNDTLEASGTLTAAAGLVDLETLRVASSLTLAPGVLAAFARLELAADGSSLFFASAGGLYDFGALETASIGGDAAPGLRFIGHFLDADTVAGTLGGDSLNGSAGADSLVGSAGADTLQGSTGDDRLEGGTGFDLARYAGEEALYVVTALGGGRFSVSGSGEGADTLGGIERLVFSDGTRDLLLLPVATSGADNLVGSDAAEALDGLRGHDTITGLGAADTLLGGNGDDLLLGGPGDDRLVGGPGADTLVAGPGRDTLLGGTGADGFLLADPAAGAQVLRDFDPAEDLILLSAAAFGLPAGILDPARFVASDTGRPAVRGLAQVTYETDRGRLYWDADGAGGESRMLIAQLLGAPALSSVDLLVVA